MDSNKTFGILLIIAGILLLIALIFIKLDHDKFTLLLCDTYTAKGIAMEDCPAHKSEFSWFLILSFGISVVILLTGASFFFLDRKQSAAEEKKTFKVIDMTKLDDEERKIYDIVKNKGGSSYQSDLLAETDFTKVKVTRLLDKLELKGILERKRRGMTNIIVLR